MNAEQILEKLISSITINLDELNDIDTNNQFVYGEKTAYVDCLEILQSWEKSTKYNLNYKIAKKYL